ncbi:MULTISPECIES: B3/4 domain-containing protein [unclassified Pantoea]|uniref:B3/B4 domain-containing protein n=1 Tax=unclassified Pantoea TaxID=2630326 RepID=UPI001CD591DB|nr:MULTISPECIES: B3/4 domain-containing protein [unclassified Pantoea]MCA1176690.1 B3/4 domain-containing protein [Pantoea sp. alder69]MCA1251603.1 B3/4 domain-containing protein [Pantoea sp. alder70]MCA1264266.1 B3/4 domain-containing protein [Pantoea sp. alder81]
MFKAHPSISPDIALLAPGFRALSISVTTAPLINASYGEEALSRACEDVLNGLPVWAESHLNAWSETFRAFGAKPNRTPCSAEALRKRVLRDRSMPALDPVVDLYNAVSLRYAIPVGGENIGRYSGAPRLIISDGSERFDTLKDGAPFVETPEAGEVIWCDDIGVTCRRWNWRQGIRTRLSSSDKHMWFILESLPEMPIEALHEAGKMLTDGLEVMMPGIRFNVSLIETF